MQSRLHLVLDALALLLAKATFIGLRLLTLYLCAAQLDRSAFGALALAFTTAEICRYVGDWGMDTWSLRQFSDPNFATAQARLHWVMRVRVVGSLVALTLAWIGIAFLTPQPTVWQHLAIATTALTSLWLNLGVNWLQARSSLRPVAGLLSVFGLVCAAALVAEHLQHAPIEVRLLTLIGFEGLMAVGVMALTRRPKMTQHGDLAPLAADHVTLGDWWRQATPIALAALVALAYGRLDQYYVSRTAEAGVLGDYTLAQRLVEPILFVAAALSSTLYARACAFVLSHGTGPATRQYAWHWVRTIALVATAAGLVLGSLFTWLGPKWLPHYTGAQPFLWTALLCTAFRCTNQSITAFIQALGAYGSMFRISLINAATITIGVLAAGTIFGPLGAAFGVCLGEALNTGLQSWTLKKLLVTEHSA
jgi:O-antigen/teichoic acid export membrane protein